jgi:lipopolysaccharide transport system ATP-binding protein
MPDTVISIENLSKCYRLGVIGTGTFYGDLKRWWAIKRGRPDPYLRIGDADHRNRIGETIWALKDINLQIQQGEALGIIGRNGAGKSTLLKILSRVTIPTLGVVQVKGRIASLLEVGTGFHPELTGRENVYLNGAIMGMNRAEVTRKFDEIVDFSGVEKFIDTPVKRYSSGMYVRLAFAVAAHLEPEILVVDEVLAVGDLEFQQKCLGKMGDVTHEGRTVLFVSHNLSAIRNLCNRCLLLEKGLLLEDASPDAAIEKYIDIGFTNKTEYLQAKNKNKPINLRKISLMGSKNNMMDGIEYKDGFTVLVEYEVNQPIKNTIVWIAIRTHEEVLVFGSADYDLDKSMLKERTPGYYRATIKISPKLLNKGSYYIVAGITSEAPVIINYDRVEACHFSIVDSDKYILSEAAERPGILKLFFPWNISKIN